MDGLLIIDKPAGPTSHDVVSRMRRLLREKRIGHTGTLDPMATGVLLLVVGRATRLSQFLIASDKSYEAVVRLGFATDTADAEGQPVGPVSRAALPPRETIEAALDEFRGTFMQQPPAFSAKKIDGTRSYKLARAAAADARLKPSGDENLPAPASVTAHAIDIVSADGDSVTLRVDCSAGFYVRSLAHDLGQRLGIGGHLAALRRTRSGDFTLEQAISMDDGRARRAARHRRPDSAGRDAAGVRVGDADRRRRAARHARQAVGAGRHGAGPVGPRVNASSGSSIRAVNWSASPSRWARVRFCIPLLF